MRNYTSPLFSLLLFLALASCSEDETAACEFESPDGNGGNRYFCIDSSIGECSPSAVTHTGKNCADIGYSHKQPTGVYYSEPSSDKKPGANGAYANVGPDCSGGYDGPLFDIQIDSQCQAAYAYYCSGSQQGVDAACAIYKSYQANNSSIPDCPYCD